VVIWWEDKILTPGKGPQKFITTLREEASGRFGWPAMGLLLDIL
jgi:hypothetical protein